MRLAERRAVVLGVGSTVGEACAVALAAEGAAVLVADPDEAVARRVAADLASPAGAAHARFASAEDASALAARCRRDWGLIDVFVDCGSAMELWPESDDSLDLLTEVLVVNSLGPLVYTRALRSLLAASSGASVVYLGSIDGIRGNPQVVAYSIGKSGLVALTRAMAAALGADGVRVNCVAAAGVVQTATALGPVQRVTGDRELALRLTPLGRMPRVEEIASVVVFLASEDASYVTGTTIPVDGGRLAATPGTW